MGIKIDEGILLNQINEITYNYDPPADIEHRATLNLHELKPGQEKIKYRTITGVGQFKLTTGRNKIDIPNTSIYLKQQEATVYEFISSMIFYDKDVIQYKNAVKFNEDEVTNNVKTWLSTEATIFWLGLKENDIEGLANAKNTIRVIPKITGKLNTDDPEFPKQLLDALNALALAPSSINRGSNNVDTLYMSRQISLLAQRKRIKAGDTSITVLDQFLAENKKIKKVVEVSYLGSDYSGGKERAIACSGQKEFLEYTGISEDMVYGSLVPTLVSNEMATKNYTGGPLIRQTTEVAVLEIDL